MNDHLQRRQEMWGKVFAQEANCLFASAFLTTPSFTSVHHTKDHQNSMQNQHVRILPSRQSNGLFNLATHHQPLSPPSLRDASIIEDCKMRYIQRVQITIKTYNDDSHTTT